MATAQPLFTQPQPQGYWLLPVALVVIFAGWLAVRRQGRDPALYYADLAWLRGGIYFSLCVLVSMLSGVWQSLVEAPWGPPAGASLAVWSGSVLLLLLFAYFAYWRIWAAGTTALDRRRYTGSALVFGSLWGFAEGQLFLALWALAERTGLTTLGVGLITYLAIGAFYGPWHRFYWDFYVAPEHNLPEWNVRKVLFVHTPNVCLTLTFLGIFRDPHTFVALMAFCLIGATRAMRFPAPWDRVSRRRIVDSYRRPTLEST